MGSHVNKGRGANQARTSGHHQEAWGVFAETAATPGVTAFGEGASGLLIRLPSAWSASVPRFPAGPGVTVQTQPQVTCLLSFCV